VAFPQGGVAKARLSFEIPANRGVLMNNMITPNPEENERPEKQNPSAFESEKSSSSRTFLWVFLAVALLVGLGDGIYSYRLGKQFAGMQASLQSSINLQGETIQGMSQQIATNNDHYTNLATDISSTKNHLGQTQSDLNKTRQLAATLAKQQKDAAEQLSNRLNEVQQDQTTTKGAVGNLSSDVSGVKQDVSNTKEQLAATQSDLKRVIGDLGIQSDLVAHNRGELAELKLRGERDYNEFDLRKSKQPQRIGNIAIALQKADVKHQKYTINLVADDRTIEKKDKNVNEPVQFYQDGYRQPTEIVVNQIYKDRIVGYVSVPKAKEARSAALTPEAQVVQSGS
jgi:uncharacterized membrane-anchored protein YhcB (DUF1043 family)